MAQGLNEVYLIGYVGKEPAVRQVGTTHVAKFQVAINETWFDAKRVKQERTTWVTCVAWGKLAQNVGKYVHCGTYIHVCGALQNNNFELNGVKHFAMQVRCDRLIFLNKVRPGSSGADTTPTTEDEGTPLPEGEETPL